MATNKTRKIIKEILTALTIVPYAHGDIKLHTIFDVEHDHYLVMLDGWDDYHRVHGALVHLQIKGDKIWIQRDGTEEGVATDLEAAGIPKSNIVLGFRSEELRKMAEYAVA